ncbi:methionine aminopeptidase [Methanothermobacter sp. CaT2]|uniref:type II methionyl aminopeptidase n=1 Tax=Methanothermobacter sp. CaT2 TaxID=866790 RepID=UPI0002CCEF67|nr:type II methionyl aminopeptidase [Methanothermobacter sp. CaT2]BAM70424.1 methionine aminopeptidase [Methanothermobacter sp. CaT2]
MIESYLKAGKIVSKVRREAAGIIRDGLPIIELVNYVEDRIIEEGGRPAFPCNVSVNEVTAHYTSPPGDDSVIGDGDLVKLDLGAHVDGFIADTAITVPVGDVDDKCHQMMDAAREALENAISTIRAGVEVGEIGRVIEETIHSHGMNPVSNLTGHSMERWILHSGLSIPNINERNTHQLEEGDVLAIEPFATDGVGLVTDMPQTYIFRFLRERPLRLVHARRVLGKIREEYHALPFAQRWLEEYFDAKRLNASMRMLIQSRAIYPYHVLREKSGAMVAQWEHTVIVEEGGCTVITE